jgi:antitoxin component YwqK of YwqJK toxin-antitoxin module
MKTITILLVSVVLSTTAFSQKLVKDYYDWAKTKIKREYYTDAYGALNGSYKAYSEYGGIMKQGQCKNDGPIGKWIENYDNGKLHYIKIHDTPGTYDFQVQDGKIIAYYEDGKTIKYERNFKNMELDGVWKEYDEKGIITKEGKYVNGVFEPTGITKIKYEKEQEKQKQLEAETLLKKTEEYKKIILEADKAILVNDYSNALQLYKSASELLANEKYPKTKISEIVETCHTNSKFFQDYIKSQYDSLELDKVYFANNISLKTIKDGYGWTVIIDENGLSRKLYDVTDNGTKYNFEKPWENYSWDRAKACFERNKGVYSPIQMIITEQFFQYNDLLEQEENNVKKTKYYFSFDNVNNSFYTYDKTTFFSNLSLSKKNYNLAKSMTALESKRTQIERIQAQNKKKILFSKFQLVYNDFNLTLQNNSDFANMEGNIRELNLFLDKVIDVYSQDTKELEKQLKNADTVESIKSIILK